MMCRVTRQPMAITAMLVAGVTIVGAQPSAELRWGGDAEGGAPFVEADPADPTRVVGFDVEHRPQVVETPAGGRGR